MHNQFKKVYDNHEDKENQQNSLRGHNDNGIIGIHRLYIEKKDEEVEDKEGEKHGNDGKGVVEHTKKF